MNPLHYTVRVSPPGAEDGTVPIAALRDLCDIVIQSSSRALRLALEGSSTFRGPIPGWVSRSVQFLVTGLATGSTLLTLQAPKLGETAFEEIRQQDLWETVPGPEDTALTILFHALDDISHGREDTSRVDLGLLDSLDRFRTFQHRHQSVIEFTNDDGRVFEISEDVMDRIVHFRSQTPPATAAIMVGHLEMIEHSTKGFKLITRIGQSLRGRLAGELSVENLRTMWGRKVTVKGTVHYYATGKPRLLEADTIRLFEAGDELIEETMGPFRRHSVPEIAKEEIDRVKDDDFLGRVWNTWPGDETIEDLLDVLKSDSPKSE